MGAPFSPTSTTAQEERMIALLAMLIAGETVKKFAKGSAEETGETAPGGGGKGESESNLQ